MAQSDHGRNPGKAGGGGGQGERVVGLRGRRLPDVREWGGVENWREMVMERGSHIYGCVEKGIDSS